MINPNSNDSSLYYLNQVKKQEGKKTHSNKQLKKKIYSNTQIKKNKKFTENKTQVKNYNTKVICNEKNIFCDTTDKHLFLFE